jgi:hypothetical protein
MLLARCYCFMQVEGLVADLGASGMFQSPLVVFLFPFMMIFPSLMMSAWYLEKRATQSSSQSWPIEMRDPWRASKMWLTCACLERAAAKGIVARSGRLHVCGAGGNLDGGSGRCVLCVVCCVLCVVCCVLCVVCCVLCVVCCVLCDGGQCSVAWRKGRDSGGWLPCQE